MKLHEVMTMSDTDITSAIKQREKTDHNEFYTLYKHLSGRGLPVEHLGSGSFAIAVSDKDEPGTARKIVHGSHQEGQTAGQVMEDPYLRYVMEISKNDRMASNPYFPKIYNVKFYESRDGKIAYTLEMERLHPLSELNTAELEAVGRQMFSNYDEIMDKHHAAYPEDRRPNLVGRTILGSIEDTLDGKKTGLKIGDPHLRHALNIIRRAGKSVGAFHDIHSGNVMVRRSPQGFRLVLVDPVAT